MITSYYTTKLGLEPETIVYRDRVESDGGEVIDLVYVDLCYKEIKAKNVIVDYSWLSASLGVKKDLNNKVSKLYSLGGSQFDLIQNSGAFQTEWVSNGMGGLPEIQFFNNSFWVSENALIYQQPNTIVIGGYSSQTSGNAYFYDTRANSNRNRHTLVKVTSLNTIRALTNSFLDFAPYNSVPHVFAIEFNGVNSKAYDNLNLTQGDLGNLDLEYISVGKSGFASSSSFDGGMNDIIMITENVDSTTYRDFINNRYNIF